MITSIILENFKCFKDETLLPLSQVTLFYGKNGRGKSSVAQSLLTLSQTIVSDAALRVLQISGDLVNLGGVKDVLNSYSGSTELSLQLNTDISDCREVLLKYCINESSNQLELVNMLVDGVDRFVEFRLADEIETTRKLGPISDIHIFEDLKKVSYISAERSTPSEGENVAIATEIQPSGKNILGVFLSIPEELQEKIKSALSFVLSGANIEFRKVGNRVELRLNSIDGTASYRPSNVGFGYSYVLPIIVSALLAPKNSLLIIENPEAHLHTAAQSRIMEFLIDQVKQKNLQLLVETHSDHVVNGLRIAVRKQNITPKDCNILYFDYIDIQKSITTVEPIYLDCKGNLSSYPDDFLDEWTKQMMELL